MYISTTNSTNTLMKELLAKGEWQEGERFLYTAFQTAGRGQAGNGWESEEGKNLLCSILLPPNKNLYFLNIAIGVALLRVIGEDFTIKWPNDIYFGDKKVAGILIENAIIGNEIKYSIAGIGLNVNQTTFLSSAPNPVSLKQITGKETDIDALMQALMTQIEAVEAMDEAQVWAYYRDHLYRREGFWPFVEREVSTAPTMNAEKGAEGIFLAKIENVRTNGEIELRDQNGNLRIYHFKQVRYVL